MTDQREKDIQYYYDNPRYWEHDQEHAIAFADGAAYARTRFAGRLRTALEFQCKKCEVDRGFEPSAIEVLEELIAELEKDA